MWEKAKENVYDELEKDLLFAYLRNQENGIKAVEIALQKVIEQRYPNKCWWEVADVPIFLKLMGKCYGTDLISEIVTACKAFDEAVVN